MFVCTVTPRKDYLGVEEEVEEEVEEDVLEVDDDDDVRVEEEEEEELEERVEKFKYAMQKNVGANSQNFNIPLR